MLNIPLFDIIWSTEINTIVWYRFHCTIGDVLITLGGFWLVSLIFRSRTWFLHPTKRNMLLFVGFGVICTIFSEIKNVSLNKLWGYSKLMPVIPYIEVGVVPLIQWMVVPIALVFIVRRQLS